MNRVNGTAGAPARKYVRGKAWYKKFAGGDTTRLAAFRAATSVRSTKMGTALLSRFVPEVEERKAVAAVLRARYPKVKVQATGRDYKLSRVHDAA